MDDASLELIVSLHVLEHIDPPDPTLTEFRRMLRVGGRLLYVVPNPQGWGHRIRGDEWFAYRDPTHSALLDRDDWLTRTHSAGFTVERVAADGLWDPPYVRRLPRPIQLATLGAPAALQVLSGRAFLPRDWGRVHHRDRAPTGLSRPAASASARPIATRAHAVASNTAASAVPRAGARSSAIAWIGTATRQAHAATGRDRAMS